MTIFKIHHLFFFSYIRIFLTISVYLTGPAYRTGEKDIQYCRADHCPLCYTTGARNPHPTLVVRTESVGAAPAGARRRTGGQQIAVVKRHYSHYGDSIKWKFTQLYNNKAVMTPFWVHG